MQLLALLLVLLVGYGARLFGLLDKNSTKKLGAFLLNVCYPLLIIASFNQKFSGAYVQYLGTVLVIAIVLHIVPTIVTIFLFRGNKATEASVLRFAAIFQNCGFIGLPLLKITFGELGAFYGASFILFSSFYTATVGAFMLSAGRKRSFGTQLKALADPALIGSVIGVVLFFCHIQLPSFIGNGVGIVGDMAIPLSFVVLGSMLREVSLADVFARVDVYISAGIKLVALPCLVLIACMIFGISKWTAYICVLMSALPAPMYTPILAEKFGANRVKSLAVAELTTILSVFTLPLVMYITSLAY